MRSHYRTVKRLGVEVIAKTRTTIEITMSEDWADCVVSQAEQLLDPITDPKEKQELRDLIAAVNEALS